MKIRAYGFWEEVSSLYPPRITCLSFLITLLAIPGAGYDLIAAWVVGRGDLAENECTAATVGNLFRNCFGGMLRDQVIGMRLVYYLALTLPICILVGIYLTHSNLRWQWLLAQRLGGVWRWWRRKTAVILVGVFLYRSVQILLTVCLGGLVFRWQVYPLQWNNVVQILVVQFAYLMLLCMLQTSVQVISGDARWSFGTVFFYLISGMIVVAAPNNVTPAAYLPGLWGIWRQSIESGDLLGLSAKAVIPLELICIVGIYGLVGALLRKRGLAQMRER
jgi:hypothetical protein